MKICTECKEEKDPTEFHKDKTKPDGRRPKCKVCILRYNKKYYVENVEAITQSNTNYVTKNRELVAERKSRWYAENREKVLQDRRDNKSRDSAKHRIRNLKNYYKLTLEDYNRMLEAQNYVCAICKKPDSSGKSLAVDHDHSCCPGKESCGKCIRGLLCGSCNRILGVVKDDTNHLLKMVEYLKE